MYMSTYECRGCVSSAVGSRCFISLSRTASVIDLNAELCTLEHVHNITYLCKLHGYY